jgi:hypothetical protein
MFSTATAVSVTGAVVVLFAIVWYAMQLSRRFRDL